MLDRTHDGGSRTWPQFGAAICVLGFAVAIVLVRRDPVSLALAGLLAVLACTALYVSIGRVRGRYDRLGTSGRGR